MKVKSKIIFYKERRKVYMKDNENTRLIKKIAEDISNLIPDCCGVTLGGSKCHNLDDENSDVEMYFYTHKGAPLVEKLTECLSKFNAQHKRTETFLWDNDMPWGPHSFFVIDGLYFEIGYRNIDDIKKRIIDYESGNVAPIQDCHDLGLGYMPSGLAASVADEKILIKETEELCELKNIASSFNKNLMKALEKEYFETAKSLIEGKLLSAAERADIFLYISISSRVIRCLMIMAFALGHKHFPGDKWNETLLLETNWAHKEEFLRLLKEHFVFVATNTKEFKAKRDILYKAFMIIQDDLKKE